VEIGDLSDPFIRERIDDATYERVTEELAMLEAAGESFDEKAVLAGYTTLFRSSMSSCSRTSV
jgi:peptide subunit release factor RF-3